MSPGYAFGSSVERFSAGGGGPSPGGRHGGSHGNLHRTSSDSRVVKDSPHRAPSHKSSVTRAWLQFQADVEEAMLRKPGSTAGMYKNLSDMMQDRMLQLDKVHARGGFR